MLDWLAGLFHGSLFYIEAWQYLAALGAIFLGFVLKKVVTFIIKRMTKVAEGTKMRFDDIIINALEKPIGWLLLLGGVYVAISILPIPEEPINIRKFFNAISSAVGIVLLAWFLLRLIEGGMDEWEKLAKETESRVDDQIVPLIRKSLTVFVYVIAAVTILQALGYSISGLLAGVGIGGAAFALASKDTVANVFGSIVVFLDQPFQIGDWIDVNGIEGTVEEVGLRTTKVRTFANSLITLPNSTFTTNSINNWSRMKKRRIKLTIGLTYDSPPEKMEQAVEEVRRILREDDRIHQEFFLVNFTDLSAYSLDIFVYAFTVTTNWAEHLQARQEFLVKVMHAMRDLGLEFAFPTQTIHAIRENGPDIPDTEMPEHMKRDLPL